MNANAVKDKATKSASRKRQVAQKQVVDDEPELTKFTCTVCEKNYFDTGLYFYGVKSTRCLWCNKFPPTKKR